MRQKTSFLSMRHLFTGSYNISMALFSNDLRPYHAVLYVKRPKFCDMKA